MPRTREQLPVGLDYHLERPALSLDERLQGIIHLIQGKVMGDHGLGHDLSSSQQCQTALTIGHALTPHPGGDPKNER